MKPRTYFNYAQNREFAICLTQENPILPWQLSTSSKHNNYDSHLSSNKPSFITDSFLLQLLNPSNRWAYIIIDYSSYLCTEQWTQILQYMLSNISQWCIFIDPHFFKGISKWCIWIAQSQALPPLLPLSPPFHESPASSMRLLRKKITIRFLNFLLFILREIKAMAKPHLKRSWDRRTSWID